MYTLFSDDFFTDNNQSVVIEPRVPQSNFPEHSHDFDEIFIVTKGKGIHVLNDRPQVLCAGMVCYIKASDHHLFEQVNDLHLTNILYRSTKGFQFLSDICQLLPDKQESLYTHWLMDNTLQQKVQSILSELDTTGHDVAVYRESLFLQLLVTLQQGRLPMQGKGNNEQRMYQLLRWLQSHFNEPIDWQELTEQFAISNRTLHRHIKKTTGCSPQYYVTKLRLAEAYYQLRYTEKSITDIAMDCGFNGSAYFSTCFKQEYHLSPRALRNAPDHYKQ